MAPQAYKLDIQLVIQVVLMNVRCYGRLSGILTFIITDPLPGNVSLLHYW